MVGLEALHVTRVNRGLIRKRACAHCILGDPATREKTLRHAFKCTLAELSPLGRHFGILLSIEKELLDRFE